MKIPFDFVSYFNSYFNSLIKNIYYCQNRDLNVFLFSNPKILQRYY